MESILFPISNLFGSSGTPANPMSGNLATEPVTGDSLTQFLRSITNFLGASGQSGMATGAGTTGTGQDIFTGATKGAQPSLDYWSAILSGDPTATAKALAPMTDTVSKQYDAAARQTETGAPRGGGRSSALAEAPFQKAGAVGNIAAGLQPAAATSLAGTETALAQLGLGETAAGTAQSGLGIEQIMGALSGLLQRRGQNTAQDAANTTAIGTGIGDILAALIGKIP